MSDKASPHLPPVDVDPEAFKHWKPERKARALELLKQAEAADWKPFYCPDALCNGHPHCEPVEVRDCPAPSPHPFKQHGDLWICSDCGVDGVPKDSWLFEHARVDQRPPRWLDDWFTLVLLGGRGSGKTRTGAEITNRATELTPRIALVAPTGPDLRATMVEGVSGILASSQPSKMPVWEPSKKQLTWPNGCIGQGYSGEEPDRLRGPQHGFGWLDEPAHYPDTAAVWDNLTLGMRLGENPKIVCTTTPLPIKWMKELIADPYTRSTRVSTYANLQNLATSFRRTVLEKFEGTRKGKQELHGEILEDVEGSLWKWEMIHWLDESKMPHMDRIVVSVDPAGSSNTRSDETGIIVVGISGTTIYVMADLTGTYTPEQWASTANRAYEDFSADAIVAEKNYGGDMVRRTLESSGHKGARIILVDSRRGKALRAEPIVALYEKTRVFHIGDTRSELLRLEEEMTSWVPGVGDSPNRVDALVHGATELGKSVMPATVASPLDLFRRPTGDSRHLRAV